MNPSSRLSPQLEESARLLDQFTRNRFLEFEELQAEKLLTRLQKDDVPFSLARTVRGLSDEALHKKDRVYLEKVAERNGVPFDRQRPYIEFRDLAVAGSGGVLVGNQMKEPVDLLRPWSVTARAGMLVETGLRGNLAVPKVSGKTTPSWVATESAQVAPSQPTLSQIAMTPKTLGNVVVFSRQLGLQANADQFVGRELLRSIGTALDQAVLNGSGTSGQPLGILNTTGIQTQSGATLNSGAWSMKQKTSEANANDEQISFISTPAVRALLETRERATGGGRFVWQEDKVADRPAHVTTDMPSGVMACGGWALIYLGIWGSGFTLEINPYDQTGFKSGLIQARMLISCDVAVLHPSAFVKADGIT